MPMSDDQKATLVQRYNSRLRREQAALGDAREKVKPNEVAESFWEEGRGAYRDGYVRFGEEHS
jgi:hypothetical protein